MNLIQWLSQLNISNKPTHNYCLICFNEIENNFFKKCICDDCLKNMNPCFKKIKLNNINGYAVYKYDETIKELLYKFKGCFDIVLKDVFISQYKKIIELLFINYVIVFVPSYIDSDIKRGFNHIKEMFSCLKNKKVDCIEKTKNIKQSSLEKNERKNIEKYLKIKKDEINLIKNKKILIVDDVLTTGSTINACYNLLKQYTNKEIKFLVMSYVCR